MGVANNTFQSTSKVFTMVLKEGMRLLTNNLTFTKNISRQYDGSFGQKGAKTGTSANAKLPNQFYVANGSNLVKQDMVERLVPITLDSQNHVGVGLITSDIVTKFDSWSENVLKPAMAVLASKIDRTALGLAQKVYNSVGTPGTEVGGNSNATGLQSTLAPQIFLNAGRILDDFGVPRDGQRCVVMSPGAHATSANGMSGLYNAQNIISNQFRTGLLSKDTLGFDFYMDQNVNRQTFGTRTNGTIAGANQSGNSANITGAGNAATILIGDTFSIANVFSVNPESQQSTGVEQKFVVTAKATMNANGANTISFSPPIIVAGANIANGTVDSLPANGANLTWYGAANESGTMNMAFHKDAFTLVTADLVLPPGAEGARMVYDNISMRIVQDYDIDTDEVACRIDVLYGCNILRPEMACKIWGA